MLCLKHLKVERKMTELKFPVTVLENEKFQVVVDMSLYAKESLVSACYKFTDRFYIHQQTDGGNVIVVMSLWYLNQKMAMLFRIASSNSSAMSLLTSKFVITQISNLAIFVI